MSFLDQELDTFICDFKLFGCNAEVDHYGQVCDPCLVANAEACGDWCNDSIAAHRRMHDAPITC